MRSVPWHLVLLVLGALFGTSTHAAAQNDALPIEHFLGAASPEPGSDDRFHTLPDFTFQSASGGTLSRADMQGKVWVAVPFFVRCSGPCPSITLDIQERLFPAFEGTEIEIVSFSLDPEFDTPEKLREYAEGRDIQMDRWHFVSATDEETMHAFVFEGLKVPIERNPDEADPGLAITHGTKMPVIDQEGRVAGFYELADPSRTGAGGGAAISIEEAEPIVRGRFGLLANRALALAGEPRLPVFEGSAAHKSPIPLFNAVLNGVSFVLLVLGIIAIKGGRKGLHAGLMRAAFVASATFLGFYLYYHFVVLPISGGPTKYGGTGFKKTLYLVMLASHVLLAIVNLPMVLRTFWLAHKEDWERHKRLAKWTFPIWLYVSVTGVAVYLVLYQFNPAQ